MVGPCSAYRRTSVVRTLKLDGLHDAIAQDALRLSKIHPTHELLGVGNAHGLTNSHREGIKEHCVAEDR